MDITATLRCMCITTARLHFPAIVYSTAPPFTANGQLHLQVLTGHRRDVHGLYNAPRYWNIRSYIAELYTDYILCCNIEVYDHILRRCNLDSSFNLFYLSISVLTFTFFLLFLILLICLIELLFNFHCHFYSSPNTVGFSIFFTSAALLSSCLF